jgi:pilus assembly protein Flp/PilA
MQGHWAVAGLERSAWDNPKACSSPLLFNFGVSNMKNFSQSFKTFWADEEGATAIEYGLLASLIAVVMAVGAGAVGIQLNTLFEDVTEKLGG